MNYLRFCFLNVFLLVFIACSSGPSLTSYHIENGGMQLFIPPTEWVSKDSKAKLKLDITYRTGTDMPPNINISFFGAKTIPRNITSIFLVGNEVKLPLEITTILYPNPKDKELRVSTQGDKNELVSLLKSNTITLTAEIDGVNYSFISNKHFNNVKNEFLIAASFL